MSVSRLDQQATGAHEEQPAAYLEELLQKFATKLQLLDNCTDDASPDDVQNAARDVSLASRSAFSEFQALEIDRTQLGKNHADRLRSLHETAITALKKRSMKDPLVSASLDSVKQRLDELNIHSLR